MNQITGPVNEYGAGLEFNYAVWSPNSVVSLHNVPWTNDYRDIVKFDNQAALNTYLDKRAGAVVKFDQMHYLRFGRPVRIPLPFNDVARFNYIRVTNPAQPVGESSGSTFYYFILDVQHLAPNTTVVHVQLDVWQSFGHTVKFGNCYVERGHIGIADSNAMTENGRILLTQPEGFDIGNEYTVEQVYRKDFAGGNQRFDIVVASNVKLYGDVGTVESPKLVSATGSNVEGLPNGCELYCFDEPGKFIEFMGVVSDAPWISQGIISITVIPNGIYYKNAEMEAVELKVGGKTARVWRMMAGSVKTYDDVKLANNFRADLVKNRLSGRYRYLTKFLTYPYTAVELTTFSGSPLVLKPECMSGQSIELKQFSHVIPPSPRVVFVPKDYNKGNGSTDLIFEEATKKWVTGDDAGEFMDLQTGFYNFPQFSVVNNGYLSFMASNAHSIAQQYNTADWSQNKALTANQLSYDQSTAAIGMSQDLTNVGINQATELNNIQNQGAVMRTVAGAAGSLMSPATLTGAGAGMALGGALMGAVNTGIQIDQNNKSLAANNAAAAQRMNVTTANASFVRDTNRQYGEFAAKGDYSNAIAAIQAKVQDARLIQPSSSGQVNGDAFNLAVYKWVLSARVKMIQAGAMQAIGEFWLRYGYAINRFIKMPDSLSVMSRFTYWKVRELYLESSTCPENYRQTIRGIFEKGVTVWNDPADIGRVDMALNEPIKKNYITTGF